jgi:cysteine desulfurase
VSQRTVYLDYAATTPVDPAVRDAMLPYLGTEFGNPSSMHRFGQDVRRAIDHTRDVIAASISADASEIYFTSGGTEADNTALLGVLLAGREQGRDHLVTTTIEHHAVLECAHFAEKTLDFRVTYVPVDEYGMVDPEAVADAVTERTSLVSVMHGNNEVGTVQPIAEIAARVRAQGAYFHTDAVQTYGQMPLNVGALGADLLTLSAHKIYGPKGAGALYVRKGVRWTPWLHGGQQEREKRAGTENAPAIIGFGKAAELLTTWRDAEAVRLAGLRDRFLADLRDHLPDLLLNGHPTERLPNNLNVSFPGTDGETLLLSLDLHGIAVSSGSACASGSIEPSHVLLALGLPLPLARAAVRFSLGRGTIVDDLDYAAGVIVDCVRSARV